MHGYIFSLKIFFVNVFELNSYKAIDIVKHIYMLIHIYIFPNFCNFIFNTPFHSRKKHILGCILNCIVPKTNWHILNERCEVTCSFSQNPFSVTAQNSLSQCSVTEPESQAYFQGL